MALRPKVLLTRRFPEPGIELLRRHVDLSINPLDDPMPRQDIITEIEDKDGLLCLLTDNIDAEIIRAGKQLKVIANYAVGYNNIDLKEATKRKIPVTNTPDVLTETTADLTFALLLSIARRIVEADKFLRQGKFIGWSPMLLLGHDVHEKNLGIIGFGRIGRAVARRAKGFGMKVLYYDLVRLSDDEEKILGVKYDKLDDLLKESDFVCIHVSLNEQTHHLITKEKLTLMKPSSYLINVARGPIIDEQALAEALHKKIIAGCALDVYEREPAINKKLLSMDNTVLVPHIGSASIETRTNMALMVAENVIAVLVENGRAPNTVNPKIYEGWH
ncbi:MAG: D-glycerate dehydrogenase [bacterium]